MIVSRLHPLTLRTKRLGGQIMGTWGSGLYSNDMAGDMRSSIKAVLRLPFDEDRIVEILRENEQAAADNPNDEDHTVFWLVLADQFERHGVAHSQTLSKALEIIDGESDLKMMEKRGMKPADLRKRGAMLSELRSRLVAAPSTSKPRKTIKAPEPFVFETNILYACPVMGSGARVVRKYPDGSLWIPDGWRQFVILNRGRAFEFLAWYQPLVSKKPVQEKPLISQAEDDLWWQLDSPKTCSARKFSFNEIEAVGPLPIDVAKARDRFPARQRGVYLGYDGRSAAINDIGIGNSMFPSTDDWHKWYLPKGLLPEEGPTMMRSLSEILATGAK